MALILALIILSVLVRLIFFNFVSYDYEAAIVHWINFIKSNGYFLSLKTEFSNYSPSYLYILVLLSYLPLPALYLIKSVSVLFDYITAIFVMLIVKQKYKSKFASWSSFFATLFTPTLILNGAVWGQSDVIYSSGVVAMLYFLIKKRWGLAIICFSLALTFKLQTVFIFPLLIILFLKEERSRKYFILIPLIFLLSLLPSYFLGRSFYDLITIYWRLQINHEYGQEKLTQNAPNIYQWISNEYVHIFFPAGLIFTLGIVVFLISYVSKNAHYIKKELLIKIALLFSLVIPFFLPRMHERYFFLADLISIIYAFYFPRLFYIPVIVIMTSFFTYSVFLFGIETNHLILSSLLLIVIVLILFDFIKRRAK